MEKIFVDRKSIIILLHF